MIYIKQVQLKMSSIVPDKALFFNLRVDLLFYFSTKTYVVGTH